MKKHGLVLMAVVCLFLTSRSQEWVPLKGMIRERFDCMMSYDNKLFLGGMFTKVNDLPSSPSAYVLNDSIIGIPMQGTSGKISAMLIHDNKLYASGTIAIGSPAVAEGIVEWDTVMAEWGNPAYKFPEEVKAITSHNGNLYMAAWIPFDNGYSVYMYNGFNYVRMTDEKLSGPIDLLTYNNTLLLAQKYMLFSGGKMQDISQVKQYKFGSWKTVSTPQLQLASNMIVFKNNLYVLHLKDSIHASLLKWNDTVWTELPHTITFTSVPYELPKMIADEEHLYIGGKISEADGQPINYIVAFDGSSFHNLGNGFTSYVYAMGIHKGELYAASGGRVYRFGQLTGLHESASSVQVSVYPNPTSGRIRINAELSSKARIEVYTQTGKLVSSFSGSDNNLLLTAVSPGLYFIRVQDGDRLYHARFIVE